MKPFARLLLLTFLFSGVATAQSSKPAPKFEELAKSTKGWDGRPLPAYPDGTPEITILKVTYPPGAATDLHDHPVISAGYLVSGELTVYTGDKTLHMKAGDSLIEIVNQEHYGRNDGEEPAVLIVVYASVTDQPITVPK
jgi:quercetin dioxygenase-like cupin family protein